MSLRVVLGVLAFLIAWAGFANRWNSDDAFINFRIVDNLLAGHGPVYNVGERVEAATSTLWLFMLAAGAWLPGPIEWFAVLAGLALTVAGVVWAGLAAARIHAGAEAPHGQWAPFGLLVFVAVPPAWHFATSGLESGLTFAWLGGTYLVLTRAVLTTARSARTDAPLAVLIGLGPLIRPDLAVFSAAFLAAWFLTHRARGAAWVIRAGVTALVLPVAYQIFRMGYYGSLVPNTALAKEASGSRPAQGMTYLADFAGAYLLVLPLLVVAFAVFPRLRASGPRSPRALMLAPVAGALLHAGFVVKVGGDFMHGRLLLPALFALALPAAVLPLRRDDARTTVPVAVVATWAVVTAFGLRPDYFGSDLIPPDNGGIADEHGFYVAFTGEDHPVTLEQHAGGGFMAAAAAVEDHLDQGLSYVNPSPMTLYAPGGLVPRPEAGHRIVTTYPTIGVFGYHLGPEVAVVDALGLADPVAARTELPPDRPGRIGHEKSLHPAWVVARFAENAPGSDPEVAAAAAALECGRVARLERAVSAPLDWRLFVNNLVASAELTALRLPPLPSEVKRRPCV